jgi:acetolactate synthase-1/2/3 large subunit
MATSGPGAANLVTGLADAFLDSIPIVAITGQVPTSVMGTDAFQEVDTLGMTMPVVKHGFLPRNVDELVWMIPEAFRLARTGRPGPVLIDLPKDVSIAQVDAPLVEQPPPEREPCPAAEAIERAANLLARAEKPLLYIGGGVAMAGATQAVRDFVAATDIPAVSTLKGIGVLPSDHPNYLGMLGMHGNGAANHAVQSCDLLIAAGARFDDRATGKLDTFAPNAAVIHMDIDAAELNKLRRANVALQGSLGFCMKELARPLYIEAWQRECEQLKKTHRWRYDAPGPGIYAPGFLNQLSKQVGEKTLVSCDVGQHQMWVAQHWHFNNPYQHLTSAGLGTMGFGLPAAMGAKLALPDHTSIVVSGDGSIMMNIQELATLNRYGIGVKIVLLNNSSLGLVRQWQELFFEERFSEVDLSDNPDFVEVAKSFGVPGMVIQNRDEEAGAIDALLNSPGAFFLEVRINAKENVWPLVAPGKSNSEMLEGVKV